LRDNWKWEAVNLAAVPREYLMLDTTKINGVVRAMKSQTNIPGIRVFNDPGMTGRPGRK
jgi:hypothetical protein